MLVICSLLETTPQLFKVQPDAIKDEDDTHKEAHHIF